MNCAICESRKPRRFCPGVDGNICSLCCGEGREETVDCPMTCEYLRAAHLFEKPPEVDPESIPNSNLEMTAEFMQEYPSLLAAIASAAVEGAAKTPGITDNDFRAAFVELIAAHRGQREGVQSSAVFDCVESGIARLGVPEEPVVRALAFLQGLEYEYNNKRRLSRAFYDFLLRFAPPEGAEIE